MAQPTLDELLKAGVHFGHQTRRWNPKMRRFIFAERNGIHIIDLQKTLRQIELALRHIVRFSTTAEILTDCVSAAVAQKYTQQRRSAPERVEEMDFSDLYTIITSGRTWSHFCSVLGGNRDLVKTRLGGLSSIRNDLFHFRRQISAEEYETLAMTRNWLLLKIDFAEMSGGGAP